jgi:hypothetical protein
VRQPPRRGGGRQLGDDKMGRWRTRRRRGGGVGGGRGGGSGRCERPPPEGTSGCERPPPEGAREGAMRAAAAGVRGGLEEPERPRHMQDRLRVLGLTGCDTGCRCGLSRTSDLLYLAVQDHLPVTVAVSLIIRMRSLITPSRKRLHTVHVM